MKKINLKVLFVTFIVVSLASFIPNIIVFISNGEISREEDSRPFALIFIVGIIFVVVVFNYVMNRLIFKRINELNEATQEVMSGNYDIQIEEGAKDEIAEVIRNFNTMITALKTNEYLSKEFVRNFSHELKTPLASIKGYSDLFIGHSLSSEEQQEYATIISNESSRLSELSKNMLLISLVDSQVIIPKQDSFNLAEQIRNVLQLTQLEWEGKSIEFDLNLSNSIITSNKEFLYHVWMNLISNAIKFSPIEGKIRIDLIDDPDKFVFRITNQGIIEENELEHVFDLFYVIEESRTKQSSGIGLALTKKIVNKFNGSISVASEQDTVVFNVEIVK